MRCLERPQLLPEDDSPRPREIRVAETVIKTLAPFRNIHSLAFYQPYQLDMVDLRDVLEFIFNFFTRLVELTFLIDLVTWSEKFEKISSDAIMLYPARYRRGMTPIRLKRLQVHDCGSSPGDMFRTSRWPRAATMSRRLYKVLDLFRLNICGVNDFNFSLRPEMHCIYGDDNRPKLQLLHLPNLDFLRFNIGNFGAPWELPLDAATKSHVSELILDAIILTTTCHGKNLCISGVDHVS